MGRHAGKAHDMTTLAARPGWVASACIVDVHSHVFLPGYLDILRRRKEVPRVGGPTGAERLLVLPGEREDDAGGAGRMVGPHFFEATAKLAFMDAHGIAVSLVSPANPWLEFMTPDDAAHAARDLNDELAAWCASGAGRFAALGMLPTTYPRACAVEADRLSKVTGMHGFVLAPHGFGRGLDDPALDEIWSVAVRTGQIVFIHPLRGIAADQMDGYGNALMLALGFVFETTIAVTRLVLSGVLDRHRGLKVLVAHGGGALPYLAARLDRCVAEEDAVCDRLTRRPSDYLREFYFDAIAFQSPSLQCLVECAGPGAVMFGSDHPFFPPHTGGEDFSSWPAVTDNLEAIRALRDPATQDAILYRNAARLFGLVS
jgi:aminocarboxymuconate-semialdehyde decarboxylase